jgi:hypothetical protein
MVIARRFVLAIFALDATFSIRVIHTLGSLATLTRLIGYFS